MLYQNYLNVLRKIHWINKTLLIVDITDTSSDALKKKKTIIYE